MTKKNRDVAIASVCALVLAVALFYGVIVIVQHQERAEALASNHARFEQVHRSGRVYLLRSLKTGRCYLGSWNGGLIEVDKEECH